jgi:hypothetical protein
MSSTNSLAPLKKTQNAVLQIRKALTPYIKLLKRHHTQRTGSTSSNTTGTGTTEKPIDKFQITEAEAAVALSIGTLRFIAARLKGQNKGKDKNDPLRMELDKMRKTLVELRGLETRVKGSNKTNGAGTGAGNKKKRKSVDVAQDVKRVKK